MLIPNNTLFLRRMPDCNLQKGNTIFFLLIATSLAQCMEISWYSINIRLINWMLQCFLNTDRRCMTFQICRVLFNHSIKYKLSLSLHWFAKCIWLFLLDIFSLYAMKVMSDDFPKKLWLSKEEYKIINKLEAFLKSTERKQAGRGILALGYTFADELLSVPETYFK